MRRAMADAEVGDDGYGEDPTVNRLETLAAALLGKDAALYVPSGTMANQLALRVLGRPGTEVLCGERAHVYRYERAAAAGNAGVQLRPLPDADGVLLGGRHRAAATAAQLHHFPPISALTVENTHMPASGRPWRIAELRSRDPTPRAERARDPLRRRADLERGRSRSACRRSISSRECDTAMFCLSKGLAAPVGSLLCGTARRDRRGARDHRSRIGGAMRQAGVIAAAGIVALETMVDRLRDDHARARTLADALAHRFPASIDPGAVQTNIVCARADGLPAGFVAALAAAGVLVGTIDVDTVRLVTHNDVDDSDIDRVITVFDQLAR